jgi:uncharacterized membrane protein
MLETELKEIWKNSSAEERIKFDLSRLIIDVNEKVSKLEQAIRSRDIADLVTSLVSIPIFGFLAYVVPFPVTRIGILLAMVGFIWNIIAKRIHQKKKQPVSATTSFREQLAVQKSRLLQEIRLSDTVLYWFLLPGFIPFAVSILGLGDPMAYGLTNELINQILPMSFAFKLGNLLFAVVVFGAIYWANKRNIRKTLVPMIEDIENAQQQLEQS